MENKAQKIIITTYILAGFLFVAIIVATQGLTTNPLLFFSKAAGNTATISVQPTKSTMTSNRSYQVWVTSDVGVGFIRISVDFDQNKVELNGEPMIVLPGFNKIAMTSMAEANATGKIILVAGLDPSQIDGAPSGTYQFATIPLAVKTTQLQTTTQITVDLADSQIANMSTSALTLNTGNSSITLNPEITTDTLTPTIIATNSPTQTNTVILTNTPTSSIHITFASPTPVSTITTLKPTSSPAHNQPTLVQERPTNRRLKTTRLDVTAWRKFFRELLGNFSHFKFRGFQ